MNTIQKAHTTFTNLELTRIREHAHRILSELVTPEGIYASTDDEWTGPYHSWFGRDSAMTTDLIAAAVQFGGNTQLAKTAQEGLLALAQWQGKKDHAATGEELGKIPHEIRTDFNKVHEVQHASNTNELPWFIDPADNILKNWDSADSTPLWIIATLRSHHTLGTPLTQTTLQSLKKACQWLLKNLETYDGLIGFTGADQQPGRRYSGLHNQGWKDSYQIYQTKDGLAKHPIKDVLISAEAWAALTLGAEALRTTDVSFADKLTTAAQSLRQKFNSKEHGFLLPDASYFAQAIDGRSKQLTQIAADPAMCLWAYHDSSCIIDKQYIQTVVETVTSPTMLQPMAGVRNYAIGTTFHQGTLYHGSSHTYWPFVSALIARGLLHFSYTTEAIRVTQAYLSAIQYFNSNIEMFREESHKLIEWHHPHVGQQSATEQAWTAAAAYYGSLFLQSIK